MASETQGITDSQYKNWLDDIACDDCGCVKQIVIQYLSGSVETLTNNEDICNLMHNPSVAKIATYQEVNYSGEEDGEEWNAIDARLTVNLERTANDGFVPIKIKRPIGY